MVTRNFTRNNSRKELKNFCFSFTLRSSASLPGNNLYILTNLKKEKMSDQMYEQND